MQARITDVQFAETFFEDWATAPPIIQEQVTRRLLVVLDAGHLTPGFSAHRADKEGTWIGWVGFTNGSWRVLFRLEPEGIMIVDRLLSHIAMERVLSGKGG